MEGGSKGRGLGAWLHGGLNDFLAVQRDVKDRPTQDGAVSKLMSYTFRTAEEKEGGGGAEREWGRRGDKAQGGAR